MTKTESGVLSSQAMLAMAEITDTGSELGVIHEFLRRRVLRTGTGVPGQFGGASWGFVTASRRITGSALCSARSARRQATEVGTGRRFDGPRPAPELLQPEFGHLIAFRRGGAR